MVDLINRRRTAFLIAYCFFLFLTKCTRLRKNRYIQDRIIARYTTGRIWVLLESPLCEQLSKEITLDLLERSCWLAGLAKDEDRPGYGSDTYEGEESDDGDLEKS